MGQIKSNSMGFRVTEKDSHTYPSDPWLLRGGFVTHKGRDRGGGKTGGPGFHERLFEILLLSGQ